jgi:hypothetical protein
MRGVKSGVVFLRVADGKIAFLREYVGGIVGSLLGVAGGLIGTYFSIKNTNGPRERAFMIRSAILCWIGVGLFLAVMFFVPQARLWIWIPCFILLPFGIRYGNKKQMAIRREEQTNA